MPTIVIQLVFEQTGQVIPLHPVAVVCNRASFVTETDYAGRIWLRAKHGVNRVGLDIMEMGYNSWGMDLDVAGNDEITAKISVTGPGYVPLYSARPAWSTQVE